MANTEHIGKQTEPKALRTSHDGRTNVWRVTCPACGTAFEPQTTLSAVQDMTCPKAKCSATLLARYNDEPPTVTVLP